MTVQFKKQSEPLTALYEWKLARARDSSRFETQTCAPKPQFSLNSDPSQVFSFINWR